MPGTEHLSKLLAWSLTSTLFASSLGLGCGSSREADASNGDDEPHAEAGGSGEAGTNAMTGSGGESGAGMGGSTSGQAGLAGSGGSAGSDGSSGLPPRAIAATRLGTCALDGDGAIHCWGNEPNRWQVPSGSFVALYPGHFTICAVRADRSVACFNEPPGDISSAHYPTVPVRELGVGYGATCGVDTSGNSFCNAVSPTYALTPPADEDFIAISVGIQFACGIRLDDGRIRCFGSEGFGTCAYSPPAGQLEPPAGAFVEIATGTNSSCALRTDGSVACWGGAELDAGAGECALVYDAGQLEAPQGTFRSISVSESHVCGVLEDRTLACWGAGTSDACESGTVNCRQSRPPAGEFEQVATGKMHSCAMTANRKVTCWGAESGGRTTPPPELQ